MNRKTTNLIRLLLDDCLPPIVRERWPFHWLTTLWLGRDSIRDFKYHAFKMTDKEYCAAYQNVAGAYKNRESDTTEDQKQWLLENIGPGKRLLEIGPGNRALTERLRKSHDVTTLDLHCSNGDRTGSVIGLAERLPFRTKSFDITIISMVLEHVRSLTLTFLGLARVTRERVLIITPQQRFYSVTFDYHLHFFYSLDHLASHIHTGTSEGRLIDGDLCLCWQPNGQPQEHRLHGCVKFGNSQPS